MTAMIVGTAPLDAVPNALVNVVAYCQKHRDDK
jgi:hypothetical protein